MILLWPGIFVLASGLENRVLAAERPECSAETLVRSIQAGHAYLDRAEYAQSERVFRAALACHKQSLAANHLTISVTLANLGELNRLGVWVSGMIGPTGGIAQ